MRQGPPRAVRAPERHFDTPKKPTLAKFGRFWAAFNPLTKQIGRVGAQYCTQVHSIGRARAVCKRYMNKLILDCDLAPFRPKLAKIDTFQPKKRASKLIIIQSRHRMGSYDAALDSPDHALEFQCLSWPFLGLRCRVGLTLRNLQLFPFTKTKPLKQSGDFLPYF